MPPPLRTVFNILSAEHVRCQRSYRYRSILSHFHSDIKGPEGSEPSVNLRRPVPIFGFSATFSRHDGLALGSVFERIVYHRDFLEMIKEQWYANVLLPSTGLSLTGL